MLAVLCLVSSDVLARRRDGAALNDANPSNASHTGVLTVAIGYKSWHLNIITANRRAYCNHHGYTNHLVRTTDHPSLRGHSKYAFEYKARMIRFFLPLHKTLVWLDADVVILDFQRPVSSFDMSSTGHDINVGGEVMTRYENRYQFSAYSGLIKNTRAGRHFVDRWVGNFKKGRRFGCDDQPPMRAALVEVMAIAHNETVLPSCARNFSSCSEARACLDVEARRHAGGKVLKGPRSPIPVWFDDIGPLCPGIALQTKQSVYQWHNNKDHSRHCWLPKLQKVLMRAFAVHIKLSRPFDFANYVDFYHRTRGEVHRIPPYPYPPGCKRGDGSTPACCVFQQKRHNRKRCAAYGERMGDWNPRPNSTPASRTCNSAAAHMDPHPSA